MFHFEVFCGIMFLNNFDKFAIIVKYWLTFFLQLLWLVLYFRLIKKNVPKAIFIMFCVKLITEIPRTLNVLIFFLYENVHQADK